MILTLCPLCVAISGILFLFLLTMAACYLGGYLASLGWHAHKREFVRQMMADCTEVSDERSITAT